MRTFHRYLVLISLSAAIALATGCKSSQNPADTNQVQDQNPSQDPAAANVAPISNASYDQGAPSSGSYATPSSNSSPDQYPSAQYGGGDNNNPDYSNNNDGYDQPVEYADQAPPPLPEYDQPPCPGDGYIWTPGYWNYGSDGYYWVPGAWVYAPYQGALWTPGYWSYDRNRYGWHRGYWGRHIGYYGGINYGFGYVGYGYQGGYWNGDQFAYNRTVNNVNTTVVRNVYNYRIVNNNTTVNRVSYNGPGGVQVRPRPAEIAAVREQRTPPMSSQLQQVQAAKADRGNFAAVNQGRPQMAAMTKPLPADHNIRPPAPVAMRNQTMRAANAPRAGQSTAQPQPQPRVSEPADRGRPGMSAQPAPRQQQPVPQEQHRPAAVQQSARPQPAPERQAPAQHAQPAPERQEPAPQRPMQEQRPAPVQHPQQLPPAQERSVPQHEAPAPEHQAAPPKHEQAPAQKPAPQHKPAPEPKQDEKDKRPQ